MRSEPRILAHRGVRAFGEPHGAYRRDAELKILCIVFSL